MRTLLPHHLRSFDKLRRCRQAALAPELTIRPLPIGVDVGRSALEHNAAIRAAIRAATDALEDAILAVAPMYSSRDRRSRSSE